MKLKSLLIIVAAGLLHILPIVCIIVIATQSMQASPSQTAQVAIALATAGLFILTFGLGYWHGLEKTPLLSWKKRDRSEKLTLSNGAIR